MAISPVSKSDIPQKPSPIKPKQKFQPPGADLKKPPKPVADSVQFSPEARAKAAQKKPPA